MSLRVVQFEVPGRGQRVGVVEGDTVRDVTAAHDGWRRVIDVFAAARAAGRKLSDVLTEAARSPAATTFEASALHAARPGGSEPWLRAPVDHADPARLLITGTGLTHVGGMKSRDQMHGGGANADSAPRADVPAEPQTEPQTDSARMFAMGLAGGRPAAGRRGAAPEWFYKGRGDNLRGPREPLEIPPFALDGGEEPEIAGVYAIDAGGRPWRLGYVLANEWSDHATEKINYLYLAPSKLRTCALGPELVLDHPFDDIRLRCTVTRGAETIYDSGELFTGERAMCHSRANCEDHHFKYPQHRRAGDVHIHFFGTSKLSYSTRTWKYQPGDVVTIEAPGFSRPLINPVASGDPSDADPRVVEPA